MAIVLLRTQKSFVFSSQRPSRNSCCLKSGVVWDSSDEQQAGLPLWQQARLTAPIESVESWQLFSVPRPASAHGPAFSTALHCYRTLPCLWNTRSSFSGLHNVPKMHTELPPTASVTLCLCVALYAWADVPKEACQS